MPRVAFSSALAAAAALLAGSERFRRKREPISPWPWTSVRFSAGLFAVGSADLGKCRRRAAFRADSACETAQKLQVGFASR